MLQLLILLVLISSPHILVILSEEGKTCMKKDYSHYYSFWACFIYWNLHLMIDDLQIFVAGQGVVTRPIPTKKILNHWISLKKKKKEKTVASGLVICRKLIIIEPCLESKTEIWIIQSIVEQCKHFVFDCTFWEVHRSYGNTAYTLELQKYHFKKVSLHRLLMILKE